MGLAPSLRLPLRLHPEPRSGTVPLACTVPQAAAWCLIQFRCASPRSARSTPRGTEPAQQNARTRQSPRPPHPGAQSGGREGPPVRLCAKGGQRPQSGAWSCGPWPACLQNFTQPSPARLAACAHDVLLRGKQFQLRMWSYEGFSLSVLCGLSVL